MNKILRIAVGVSFCIWICGCQKDPKKFMITEKNKETYLEDIKDMKGLTVGEVRSLIGYEIIRGGKKFNGDNADLIVGKSIEQVLEIAKQEAEFIKRKQKEYQEEQEKQKEKQKEKEEQEKVLASKKQQLLEMMKKALLVTIEQIEVVPKSPGTGVYNDHLVISFSAQSQLDKGVRALRGSLVFGDLFNKEMCRVSISYDEAIEPRKLVKLRQVLQVNPYDKGLVWLKETASKDMKWVWNPESMLLSDGTIASIQ